MNRPTSDIHSIDIESPAVPLPNEIPPPPDLSSLPTHILHSGTMETLIGLNEDLMARLKVNIRRNGVLEQQLIEQERTNSELTRVNSRLSSQLQVLREKEQVWREKTSRAEEGIRSLQRLNSFQRRVQTWVRPMVDRLKADLLKEKEQRQKLSERLASRELQANDLRARLNEAVQHAQNIEKQSQRDQTKLVDKYENRLKSLETDLDKHRAELKITRDKALRLDEAVAARTDLENRIVFLERRNADMEKLFNAEIHELQEQVNKYRSEAKILAVETLERDRKFKETSSELSSLRTEHEKLQDQFESLQTVWANTQKNLETAKIQHESLNRLNQELSRQLKEQRKSMEKQPTPEGTPQLDL